MESTALWRYCAYLVVLAGSVLATLDCNIDKTDLPSDTCTFDLRMRNARPTQADQYICSGYSVKKDILSVAQDQTDAEGYIVRFEALADAGTAHHILVFGCEKAYRKTGFWSCGTVCEGKEQIIFAWAKNAPPLTLPKDVGRRIGKDSQINHIVIQIHYAKPLDEPDNSGIRIYTTHQRQQYLAGIYLLLAYETVIPPNTPKVHADISCRFNWPDSIVPFGYRTHAHVLGKVISGYKNVGKSYEMIGKGNPQWPQAFYPVQKKVVIEPGDILAARCTFNSTGRNRKTFIGSTAKDEMCNFYIMYYTNATSEGQGSDTCAGNHEPQVFRNIPADSDTPLPPNPDLEDEAKGHHHHHAMTGDNNEEAEQHQDGHDQHIDETPAAPVDSRLKLTYQSAVGKLELGQVTGLDVSNTGDLYIFHRGSRIWNSLSFDMMNNFQYQNEPVEADPIIVVDLNGNVKQSFGKNRFYLPHGLTLDKDENVWVTDVALHQVFRLPRGGGEPDMTLGIRWEPGSDKDHFCKPTDVAVLSSGEFFVADGYCNSRIMKFDKNGYFLQMWGKATTHRGLDSYPSPGMFSVPHSLALAEDRNQLCVADRENGRIQCFNLNGTFVRQMHPSQVGETLYAVEYCKKHGGVLFAVNGPSLSQKSPAVQGLTFDINTGALISTWNVPDNGLTHPHDVTVDSNKHLVYVGELNPSKVWKFKMVGSSKQANSSASAGSNKGAVKTTAAPVITDASVDTVAAQKTKLEEKENFAPSLIIGMLLVVPVVILVAVTVLIRLYHTGYFRKCAGGRSKHNYKFNLGNFLNSHKGFDRLSTEDDDHDLDNALDDSDNEEFSIVRKA